MTVHTFSTPDEMADALCTAFRVQTDALKMTHRPISIALSGGTTPVLFLEKLAEQKEYINWKNIHFFWVDERCVPPDNKESNYGMARNHLLSSIELSDKQIHRIQGENDPDAEAVRYAAEMKEFFQTGGWPAFDWIFLGIGDDGHTASIFPGRTDLLTSDTWCAVAHHPRSGQPRVTLTGHVLQHARRISFLAMGTNKSQVVASIIKDDPDAKKYPASYIRPSQGNLEWYLDLAAANQLKPH